MPIIYVILCFIGAWQTCKWLTDLLFWAFGTPERSERWPNRITNDLTLEELMDELERKAKEEGVSMTIGKISFEGLHDRYKPSDN